MNSKIDMRLKITQIKFDKNTIPNVRYIMFSKI